METKKLVDASLIDCVLWHSSFDSMDVEAMSDGEDDEETNGAVTNSDGECILSLRLASSTRLNCRAWRH